MNNSIRQFGSLFDVFGLFQRDPFGNFIIVKRLVIGLLGALTYARYVFYNKTRIEGMEHIRDLPQTGVLFLANHQTYFADVICLYHIFCSVKWGFVNTMHYPIYLLAPRANNYYVAASETMHESGLIPKLFAQGGALTVNRSWRANGENVQRGVDTAAGDKVGMGLQSGWVVSFPQGTTKPFAPVRKGTAHLIRTHNPIVVPVVIEGFNTAFDKKGLFLKKLGTPMKVRFKEPIRFDEGEKAHWNIEELVSYITEIIEQVPPTESISVSTE